MKRSAASLFAIWVRLSSGTYVSSLRVITTSVLISASISAFSRFATSRTSSFSEYPDGPMLPLSCPPWPASITTRDSFRPRLRIKDLLDGLASTATRMGSALTFAGAAAIGESARGVDPDATGAGAGRDTAIATGSVIAGGGVEAAGATTGTGTAPAIDFGAEGSAVPATSMIILFGSFSAE